METSENLSDSDQSSNQEGESRSTSVVGSYEDDFERELEFQMPCSYDEEKLDDLFRGSSTTPFELLGDKELHGAHVKWKGRDGAPIILDHAAYRDCDEDLENALTVAYTENMNESNGHFYLFKRDVDSQGLSSRGRRFLDIFRRRFKHYNTMKEKGSECFWVVVLLTTLYWVVHDGGGKANDESVLSQLLVSMFVSDFS